MIKLIASDIDGTLLEDGGHDLNPELFEVILKLRAAGMQFAVCLIRVLFSLRARGANIEVRGSCLHLLQTGCFTSLMAALW